MTLPNDLAPCDSDDPAYRDTWWFNATDVEARRGITMHCIWNERQKLGRHTLMLHGPDRSERLVTLTRVSPFRSDLLTLEVEACKSMRLVVPSRGIDVVWTAWHDPVDFSQPPFSRVMSSMHLQASGQARGTVLGQPFSGHGHRDRTSGPRDMTRAGRTVGVTLVGVDRKAAILSHVTMPGTARYCDEPSGNSGGYSYVDGEITPRMPGDTKYLRRYDGSLGAIRVGDETFVIEQELAPVRFTPDGNLVDPQEASERVVYTTLQSVLFARSERLGRFTGGYGESMVMTF